MSVLAYTMGRFPATELVDLPHGYPSGWVATKVANDYYNEFEPEGSLPGRGFFSPSRTPCG